MPSTKSEGDERRFFMGLDASTQSLKASLLDEQLRVVGELGVNFDADVAQHKTQSGVLHGPDGQVFSPVELLTDALELLFVRLKQADWPLRQVKAISASGQASYMHRCICEYCIALLTITLLLCSNTLPCTGRSRALTSYRRYRSKAQVFPLT